MKSITLIISILIALNIFLCGIVIYNNITRNNLINNLEKDFFYCCEDKIRESLYHSLKYQDSRFTLSNEVAFLFDSIFGVGYDVKLMYRLDFPHCGNCSYPIIEKLEEFSKTSLFDVVILPAFPSNEYMDEFNLFMLDKELLHINIPDLDFSLSQTGLFDSHLFLMDSSLKPHQLYFVNLCTMNMIDDYLNLIHEKYILK